MWTIYKKELKSYFLSPIGYIAIGLFLIVFSTFFLITTINQRAYDMGYLYLWTIVFALPFMTAMLTMRMFAEERKNGTEQLLLTSPRSITSIIFGKFLAALTIVLITLVFSLLYYVILCFFKAPNLVTTLISILGFILISMVTISWGMFASSITEHQAVAAILTFIPIFVPTLLFALWGIDLSIFNILNSYEKFPAGLISISEVVTLLAYTVMFILFTIIIMQRRKAVR